MKSMGRLLLASLAALLLLQVAGAVAAAPRAPCAVDTVPVPAYAAEGAPPAVAVWRNVKISGDPRCLGRQRGSLALVVALAGQFRHGGTLDDLAARAGAMSRLAGLKYWSASEQRWRYLVTSAAALTGADVDWRNGAGRRVDFAAGEMRSGETLWFVQDDTRSTGDNLYSLRSTLSEPGRLAVEVVNESSIRFLMVTLFEPGELLSLHLVERIDDDLWGYYGLAAVRGEPIEGYGKSLVNRAAALHRFLLSLPGDAGPPLAP